MHRDPDLAQALIHYAQIADQYDRDTERIASMRLLAIAALQLRAGQTVLDVGCGTGACLLALSSAVGANGQVIAIEPSAELLRQARARVALLGLSNVRFHACSAEAAPLSANTAHAALFCYTHDVLQSEAALDNIFAALAPAAAVVACGTQLLPAWCFPLPQYQKFTHRHYIVAQDSMKRPWALLEQRLRQFDTRRVFPWHSYLAKGLVPQQERSP
jgi:ubiquinone/menaquinone biosynthesis C-methylase UbiE